jgi:hypothetical protein
MMPSVDTSRSLGVPSSIVFESFGVRLRVTGDAPEVIERIPSVLPPDARPCRFADETFALLTHEEDGYQLTRAGSALWTGPELESALGLLEHHLQSYIGLHAPNAIFVHAGVVTHNGRAIVIPGRSTAGKSTLVLALVRAGAVYYSDEFAVVDERGLVHPYAVPLSLRDPVPRLVHIERFGGRHGGEPVPIGAVMVTAYREGTEWNPTPVSPGRGALAMFDNTIYALTRSQEAMRLITRGLERAVVLEGERGEADEIAQQLLNTVFAEAQRWPGTATV